MADEKQTMYAQKRQVIHDVCAKGMEMEVFRELDFLRDLQNPFICNAHFAFHDKRYLYIIMDVALGGDLRFHIGKHLKSKKAFKKEEVKFFLGCIILGLEYIHECGVLHRDIKPDNFLVSANGYVKITDFGISSFVDKKTMVCNDSSGTLGYMAPEVYRKGHKHNVASESFSLGVCLHELVCLRRPYENEWIKDNAALIKTLMPTTRSKMEEGITGKMSDHPEGKVEILPESYKGQTADSSDEMRDICEKLLTLKPSRRLGNKGMKEVKAHKYFDGFDFDKCEEQKMAAPFLPDTSVRNASGFSDDMTDMFSDAEELPEASERELEKFVDYHLNTEIDAPVSSQSSLVKSGRDRQAMINPMASSLHGLEEGDHDSDAEDDW
ncbi:hypothetical protein TrVE_jg12589 [Triparma verrucosa]|uniref:Protein kinase domain-containing protein n=2 Tax=Triparma TaxID=722752 RepID=A0A9W7EDP1_9STRA|nr:hypothetical protein TrST_g9873 [Triparma strigata]GMI13284.1 hypothetical protein TrVE_jg12589 [Triparma verrucosa]